MRVAVIGGGISGLAAAHELVDRVPGIDVIVLEASERVGGKLRTGSVAGLDTDLGAEAMLARRPEALELARAVGLGEALIEPLTTTAAVRAGGATHPLPTGTMMGIPSDVEAVRAAHVLSDAALARVEAEILAPGVEPLLHDVAVGELVRERLGNEVVDRLVEPLLGGVYAGRADDLSLRATMPALAAELGRSGGSLIAAARVVTDVGARSAQAGPVFMSLAEGGVGRLPHALVATGRFTVRTQATVRALRRTEHGFVLTVGAVPSAEELAVDAVVVAVPAAKAALLLREVSPVASAELGAVDSASMAVITLAFEGIELPSGSGLLVGATEGFGVKAVTLSSQKWPMATGSISLVRASVGRAGETHVLQREDDELIALVRHELQTLIGVHAVPVDAVVTRWGGGLPQYGVGHVERVQRVRAAVAKVAGLAVCGAAFDGVGIPACIASARAAVEQIVGGLVPAPGLAIG